MNRTNKIDMLLNSYPVKIHVIVQVTYLVLDQARQL